MKTVCEQNQCAGCMACMDICSKKAITIQDDLNAYNAIIDTDKCVDCGACHKVCQQNNPLEGAQPEMWYQGWCKEESTRIGGSSGGLAGAISKAFVEDGGTVCSCLFTDGEFKFDFIDSVSELQKFAGSKYVKSNAQGIYRSIRARLKNGKKVLFIGLPCQVAALRRFIPDSLQEKLFTVDLICHGTPSPKLLELFLQQYNRSLNEIQDIRFRVKGQFQVYEGYQGIITTGVTDKYLIAFLNSLIYTENCYQCKYAATERISDLTLGDSWGSTLPEKEKKRGISLALAQTGKGIALLNNSNVHLEAVDVENAVRNNHQLSEPSHAPNGRVEFFQKIKDGKKFNKLVFRYVPKACIKQNVKEALIKLGLRKSGGGNLSYGVLVKSAAERLEGWRQ